MNLVSESDILLIIPAFSTKYYRIILEVCIIEVKKLHLDSFSTSSLVNWNMKSSSNFSILFLTC